MAYTPEQKEEILNKIFLSMTEEGTFLTRK